MQSFLKIFLLLFLILLQYSQCTLGKKVWNSKVCLEIRTTFNWDRKKKEGKRREREFRSSENTNNVGVPNLLKHSTFICTKNGNTPNWLSELLSEVMNDWVSDWVRERQFYREGSLLIICIFLSAYHTHYT